MLVEDWKAKWELLQQRMKETGAEACVVTRDVNLYYLTGQVFNGYFYLPVEGNPLFLVKRPSNSVGEFVIHICKPEDIPGILSDYGLKLPDYLLLETDELSYNEYVRLQKIFTPREIADAGKVLRNMRQIKTFWEIEQLRISAWKHAEVYSEIPQCYRSGMTDIELQYEIEYRMRQHGSIGLFRAYGPNMDIFMGSLLAGENAEEPSPFDFALGGKGAHPFYPLGASGITLCEGMSVMVDMAGNYTAYMTDMTRVFSVGRLNEKAYHAHRVSQDIHAAVIEMARPGTACAEIYETTLDIVRSEHLDDCFMGNRQQAKFVGHGIGIEINELPVLTPRSQDYLLPGMTIALEPKFVISGTGAVGFENTFLVTENGLEKLTILEEDIISLC